MRACLANIYDHSYIWLNVIFSKKEIYIEVLESKSHVIDVIEYK